MVTRNTGGSGISFSHSPVAGTGDDALLTLGAGTDAALVLRSTALSADAELSGVIVGTSDHPGVAANSLIIANQTADGDIMLATQSLSLIHI